MFGSIGLSYREASVEMREKAVFTPESGLEFRSRASKATGCQVLTLSTCNRTEVFFFGPSQASEQITQLFFEEFPLLAASKVVTVRKGREALTYLCRIAAGLESMILGEYQILGQLKSAYAEALASGHVGKELDRILRDAISAAKRVKTELDIGAVSPSVCRAGVEAVDAAVGFYRKRVFVIGSGKTGSLAARLARERGAASLAICNRSPERAARLALELNATVVDYGARHEIASESDIVISATASPHVVLKESDLRLTRPVCFLDLAVPHDVEPLVALNPLARLISIDSIGALAEGDRAERERLTAQGMDIIRSAVDEIEQWLKTLKANKGR